MFGMCMRLFCVFVMVCVGRGLAISCSSVQGVLLLLPLVLQPSFGPRPTSMKLSVSLRFIRS
jgi:hypothetical protein